MASFVTWLLRRRDQCSVSYSRFGGPGDISEDIQQPTRVFVESFDDNAPEFKFMGICHCQKAALLTAGFGMSVVMLMTISAILEIDWYNMKGTTDLFALTGIVLFLCVGFIVHYCVNVAIRKQSPNFLLPFITSYLIVIGVEFIFIIYQLANSGSILKTKSQANENLLIVTMLIFAAFVSIHLCMLSAILKCRLYLSARLTHEMAMMLAERCKTKYPGLQIMLVPRSSTFGPRILNV